MLLGQSFPRSEASQQGVSYRNMLRELGILGGGVICLLLGLFFNSDLKLPIDCFDRPRRAASGWRSRTRRGSTSVPSCWPCSLITHALVGYVELGTDSWIGKITGAIMDSKQRGLLLFVYTSSLMFMLRFFAGPIVERTSPLGLLFASGILGASGLTLLSYAESVTFCVVAATVYACGKTFLWPTMLAVVSEQFPRGGAITIGAIGGVGMLSAGLLGGPGIGFEQDHYASEDLKEKNPAVFERYKAPTENTFLVVQDRRPRRRQGRGARGQRQGGRPGAGGLKADPKASPEVVANQQKLVEWWESVKGSAAEDKKLVTDAGLFGGRMALRLTAIVPAVMAPDLSRHDPLLQDKGGLSPAGAHHQARRGRDDGGRRGRTRPNSDRAWSGSESALL